MAIVGWQRFVGLAENKVLPDPGRNACVAASMILDNLRGSIDDLLIKPCYPVGGFDRHVEFHISDSKRDWSETRFGLIASDAIAPRTDRVDVSVALLKIETGAIEEFAHFAQPLDERLPVRNNHANMTPQDLRLASGQMKLRAPDIDPHVDGASHQKWIARQSQTSHVENCRDLLIGYRHIDMLQGDYVAKVFGGAVE